MQHLLYHQPFEKVTLSFLPAQFRSAIANNDLGIDEGRLVFYETVITTANKICRIVVPVSLRYIIVSFYTLYPLPVIWGSIKIFIELNYDSSG